MLHAQGFIARLLLNLAYQRAERRRRTGQDRRSAGGHGRSGRKRRDEMRYEHAFSR